MIKRLEDEIKQRSFKSQQEKVLVNLIYTYNFFEHKFEELLKQFDITPQQYNILRILKGQYPNSISLNEIKNRMLDRNSDVSRIVERMRKKTLLTRTTNPKNRRAVEIKITSKGIELLNSIEPYLKKYHDMLSHMSENELKNLNELLDKLRSTTFNQ
ncbi:MAG: MarR family transcriptional regulator [Bacteroidia bacterium]|nr:MAG: MarR family transcriptional regulator [Bacteroidia bacterium]